MTIRIKSSPCIGFCSTTYGDEICRGCFRNLDEVLFWRQKSIEEKVQYYQRISRQVRAVLPIYWTCVNPEDLAEKIIAEHEVFTSPDGKNCVYFLLFQLLQHGVNPLQTYSESIQWNTKDMTLADLARIVSRSVYIANENAL